MKHQTPQEIRDKTAECLRYIRTEVFCLNRQQMADKIGINRPQYTNYELGKVFPMSETFRTMSNTLGLSLTAFTDISVARKEGKEIRAHLDTAANSDLIWQQAVCRHLQSVRTYVGVKRDDLAKAAAISVAAVERFEAGTTAEQMTKTTLHNMAEALHVSENVLLDEDAYRALVPEEYRLSQADWEQLSPKIGARLYAARQRKHLTMRDMAREMEIPHVAIHFWETGARPIPRAKIKALADFFEMSVHELITPDPS